MPADTPDAIIPPLPSSRPAPVPSRLFRPLSDGAVGWCLELPDPAAAGLRFRIDFSVCPNPFCDCAILALHAWPWADIDTPEDTATVLELDVSQRTVAMEDAHRVTPFYTGMQAALTPADWDWLDDLHAELKQYYFEEEWLPKNLDDFPKDIEEALLADPTVLVPLHAVFPLLERVSLDIDGQRYDLLPMFCANPDCDCTDALVDVFAAEVADEEPPEEPTPEVASWRLNYRTRACDEAEGDARLVGAIRKQLGTDGIRQLCKLLAQQHSLLRCACDQIMEESQPRDVDDEAPELEDEPLRPIERETPKVGRNAPCPCGSGKKYKNCCGA